ncbi:MAG: DUF3237 family protein [Rhizobiaceae bacterium]
MGDGRSGRRRIIPIVGGTASGERLNGRILNLGYDWQTVFADGSGTRYALFIRDA